MSDSGQDAKAGVMRTPREIILVYLYQNGESRRNNIEIEAKLPPDKEGRNLDYLKEHDFVEQHSSSSKYDLTEKGEEFVEDQILNGS